MVIVLYQITSLYIFFWSGYDNLGSLRWKVYVSHCRKLFAWINTILVAILWSFLGDMVVAWTLACFEMIYKICVGFDNRFPYLHCPETFSDVAWRQLLVQPTLISASVNVKKSIRLNPIRPVFGILECLTVNYCVCVFNIQILRW